MSMFYFEAPNQIALCQIKDWDRAVFLGGSITGAANWQNAAKTLLQDKFHILNPRRENFDVTDPENERTQITWEYKMLEAAGIILFYFSWETMAPITLFELGKCLRAAKYQSWKKIYICVHPEYKRRNDVLIQTELESFEVGKKIRFDLVETCEMIILENS